MAQFFFPWSAAGRCVWLCLIAYPRDNYADFIVNRVAFVLLFTSFSLIILFWWVILLCIAQRRPWLVRNSTRAETLHMMYKDKGRKVREKFYRSNVTRVYVCMVVLYKICSHSAPESLYSSTASYGWHNFSSSFSMWYLRNIQKERIRHVTTSSCLLTWIANLLLEQLAYDINILVITSTFFLICLAFGIYGCLLMLAARKVVNWKLKAKFYLQVL